MNVNGLDSQLTLRGVIIGVVGCVIITVASVYTALKMGALPWPIIFAALVSLGFLRALSPTKGYPKPHSTDIEEGESSEGRPTILNEANVTHTIMSAGAMIAGGLAFTIPGIWIISQKAGAADAVDATGSAAGDFVAPTNSTVTDTAAVSSAAPAAAGDLVSPTNSTVTDTAAVSSAAPAADAAAIIPSFPEILAVAIAGSLIGLLACSLLRKRFINDANLEFPIGTAAAQTLKVGDEGRSLGAKLFAAMGLSGAWCFLRDGLRGVPSLAGANLGPAGVAFGIYLSPLMVAVGFLVGTAPMVAWFAGALWQWAWVGLIGTAGLGLSAEAAASANNNLGMGLMMGCGIAIVVKELVRITKKARGSGRAVAPEGQASSFAKTKQAANIRRRLCAPLALLVATAAFAMAMLLGLSPIASVLLIALAFVAVAMSAQSVGQTGIDPMEIFGLIVLLAVAAIGETDPAKLFFVAAIVAVACGLGGDLMNDLKAGAILHTSPQAQLAGQAIGAVVGCIVGAGAVFALGSAYGPQAFGPGREFVAAQASVVATLVSGLQNPEFFALGFALGFGLYIAKAPSMMIGLGVYLPFYLSVTAFLGCLLRLATDAFMGGRLEKLPEEQLPKAQERYEQTALVVASGVLGGESVVGVLLAIWAVASALL